jgi:hypothetical protein
MHACSRRGTEEERKKKRKKMIKNTKTQKEPDRDTRTLHDAPSHRITSPSEQARQR